MKKIFKTKKSRVLTIVLVIILVIAILIGKGISSAKKALSGLGGMVSTVTVEKRDLSDAITLTGTVKGATINNVASEAPAKFTAVNVSVGDRVNAGDLLAVMDPSDIEASIKDKNKALGDTNALNKLSDERNQDALEKAQSNYDKQMKEAGDEVSRNAEGLAIYAEQKNKYLAEMNELEKSVISSKEALDVDPNDTEKKATYEAACKAYKDKSDQYATACFEYDRVEKQLDLAKKQYELKQSEFSSYLSDAQYTIDRSKYTDSTSLDKQALKTLKEQLEDCNVYAPISGVVTAVNVAVGDTNLPGKTIITIQDTTTMVLDTPVEETQILKLEENMKAVVTSTATGDKKLDGTVTRVVRVKSAGGLDGSGGTYAAEITLEDSELLVGMTAKAKIVLNERKEVLAVPYDLIQEDENGNKYVLAAVRNDDGTATAVRRNVEVGEEINYFTIITGGELVEGDEIFFDSAVEEGQTIVIMNDFMELMEG